MTLPIPPSGIVQSSITINNARHGVDVVVCVRQLNFDRHVWSEANSCMAAFAALAHTLQAMGMDLHRLIDTMPPHREAFHG